MVKIRLRRTGRTNQPYYRIEVFDSRAPRDGRSIESLGSYNPHGTTPEEKVQVKRERVMYWLDKGAQMTDSVASLLKKHGIYAK